MEKFVGKCLNETRNGLEGGNDIEIIYGLELSAFTLVRFLGCFAFTAYFFWTLQKNLISTTPLVN